MVSTTAILVGGGVVAGGVILVARMRAAQRPPSPCGAFGTIVGDVAGMFAGPADASANSSANAAAQLACNLLGAIDWGSIRDRIANALGQGPGCLDYDRENQAKNGAITERISTAFEPVSERNNIMCSKPGVLAYANGCVPYRGHPDFAKCAPGTHHMSRNPDDSVTAGIGTGVIGADPTTRRTPDGKHWLKGREFTCPNGQTPAVDHRAGAGGTYTCWSGGDWGPPGERDGDVPNLQGDGTRTEIDAGNLPPGYCRTAAGVVKRRRADGSCPP